MIVFDLRCPSAHVFEAWFGSTADYESQCARGLVACPICGDTDIEKAVMAPAVAAKGNNRAAVDSSSQLLAMQRQFEAGADYVGPAFATEARSIHDGVAPARGIYGEASIAEAKALLADGISVLPMPFRPRITSDA